jgi:oligopeptide transport system substrate-binding protein
MVFKRIIFITLVLIFLLASTAPQAAALSTGVATQILYIETGTQPDTLDPQFALFVNEASHLKLIYEGLTRINSTLQPAPGAAESWTFSSDHKQVTFTLRENLQYSDGSILNAKRFEYSILRTLDPLQYYWAEYGPLLDLISGAYAYRTADTTLLTQAQIDALRAAVSVRALDTSGLPCNGYAQTDCHKLQIDLTKPGPTILSIMSMWMVYPARQEVIEQSGRSWWMDPANQIGNGPFKLIHFAENGNSLFVPNPRYWRGVPGYFVDYRYNLDSALAFNNYMNGLADIIPVASQDLPAIHADPVLNSELHAYSGDCTFAVFFNTLKAPFNDPKVRAAFAYAIDRQAWVEQVLGGVGFPTLTWVPPGLPGYNPDETRWGYNPAKARDTLQAAGYEVTNGVLTRDGNSYPITLTFSDTPRNRTRNEWLQVQWNSVLGVYMKLNPVEPVTYVLLTRDVKTAPQTYILGWCADHPDPQGFLSVYWRSTTTFAQRLGYSNPQVDALLDQADAELDPSARIALYQQAQDLIIADVPGAMLWNNASLFLVRPQVTAGATSPFDYMWPGEIDPLAVSVNKTYYLNFLPTLGR